MQQTHRHTSAIDLKSTWICKITPPNSLKHQNVQKISSVKVRSLAKSPNTADVWFWPQNNQRFRTLQETRQPENALFLQFFIFLRNCQFVHKGKFRFPKNLGFAGFRAAKTIHISVDNPTSRLLYNQFQSKTKFSANPGNVPDVLPKQQQYNEREVADANCPVAVGQQFIKNQQPTSDAHN